MLLDLIQFGMNRLLSLSLFSFLLFSCSQTEDVIAVTTEDETWEVDSFPLPDRFFAAYSPVPVDDWSWKEDFQSISKELETLGVESTMSSLHLTNWKLEFENDTFDVSYMQQVEERQGYWFYEKGLEPLDMGWVSVDSVLRDAKLYFSGDLDY